MNKYEILLDRISREIPVIELPLKSLGFEGTYFNGAIYVDSSMATSQKIGVLTEEYAHFKTSVGTIIDYDDSESRKQELKARGYSIEMLVTLDDIVDCHLHGLTNIFECAEHLEVSVALLKDSFKYFFSKFGVSHSYKNYFFIFSDESVKILDKKIS